jgi:hypothetical protein
VGAAKAAGGMGQGLDASVHPGDIGRGMRKHAELPLQS